MRSNWLRIAIEKEIPLIGFPVGVVITTLFFDRLDGPIVALAKMPSGKLPGSQSYRSH